MNERDNHIFTQQMAEFTQSDKQSEHIVRGVIDLKNGFRFIYRHGHIDLVRAVMVQVQEAHGRGRQIEKLTLSVEESDEE